MATQYDALNDPLTSFIRDQHIFFCATAGPSGRVNISPKGMDSLRVMGPNRIVWRNLTGSGNETAGHLAQIGPAEEGETDDPAHLWHCENPAPAR